jgi:hypothetical protein
MHIARLSSGGGRWSSWILVLSLVPLVGLYAIWAYMTWAGAIHAPEGGQAAGRSSSLTTGSSNPKSRFLRERDEAWGSTVLASAAAPGGGSHDESAEVARTRSPMHDELPRHAPASAKAVATPFSQSQPAIYPGARDSRGSTACASAEGPLV